MDPLSPNAAGLTPEEQRRLAGWLREFDLKWEEAVRSAHWVGALPPDGPLRRAALAGMVKIDLRRQWQRGRKKPLEDYLRAYPELGTAETVGLDLIQAEMQARRQAGESVTFADLVKRFPRQMGQLRRSLAQVCASPAHQEAASPTALPGTRAPQGSAAQKDRYRILKELGRGAMGTVYLAQDHALKRPVALKIPHFHPGKSPELFERFLCGVRAAVMLHHPNICPAFEVGEGDGRPYLTMAYIEGQTLAEVLRACRPMPQRRAVEIVSKLARALEEMHRWGVVHRGLSPSNIMIDHRGEPVLIGFSLARRIDRDERLTRQGSVMGTPAYMSPEQVQGERDTVGPASDQYSLGVILYELLTGQLPFQGSIGQVMVKILQEAPKPPSWVQPDLDPALEEVCLRAMAKEPANRYPSAGEFAAALARCLGSAG
jgi:hypothetical protein